MVFVATSFLLWNVKFPGLEAEKIVEIVVVVYSYPKKITKVWWLFQRWWKILSSKFRRGRRRWRSWYKIIIIIIITLLKNSSFSRNLLSLSLISRFLMSGAFSRNLLKPFFPMSTSLIKEPITGFCTSKCYILKY